MDFEYVTVDLQAEKSRSALPQKEFRCILKRDAPEREGKI